MPVNRGAIIENRCPGEDNQALAGEHALTRLDDVAPVVHGFEAILSPSPVTYVALNTALILLAVVDVHVENINRWDFQVRLLLERRSEVL